MSRIDELRAGRMRLERRRRKRSGRSAALRLRAGGRRFDRALSLTVAVAVLPFALPVMLVLAAWIRLDSAGPVLFFQRRIGLQKRPFQMIKFRTMHPQSTPRSEWAGDNTDRITRAGRWLRRTHLDELPQLFNVLAGQMNLVGPRPHPEAHLPVLLAATDEFGVRGFSASCYDLRMQVRPGITGWAQLRCGYANDLEQELEKISYDVFYVMHRSLRLDLQILLATCFLVVSEITRLDRTTRSTAGSRSRLDWQPDWR